MSPAPEAALIRAALVQPLDSNAAYRLARFSPSYNALLRTTCIPTMLAGGHAENALARAGDCDGQLPDHSRRKRGHHPSRAYERPIPDTGCPIKEIIPAKPSSPSPLLPERLALVKSAIRATWGREVPITPVQENGATDGVFFRNAGIPVYGVTGIPMPVGEDRMHGKDERIPAKSFRDGVTFATVLIAETAGTRKNSRK